MKFRYVLCAVCAFVFPAHALDREAFTITRYDLKATIEPEQQRLGVRGKISLRNDSDLPQRNLVLQISSTLHWISGQFESKPVEFLSQQYMSDIDHTGSLSEAIVVLAHPVPPKQTIELEIGYEGIIPQDATRLTRIGVPAETAKHSDWDQISRTFTGVRGIGHVAWYPVATEAANLSDGDSVFETVGRWKQREAQAEMKIRFTYSNSEGARPILYCNGRGGILSEEDLGRAHSSECGFGSTGSVPMFLIGSYAALDRPAVNLSYLPEHKVGAENYALAVEQTFPLVTKWLGDHRDAPELKAQVIELPDSDAAPFESGNILLMPLISNDTQFLLLAAQQLTQVLFNSPRPWIAQGLPLYAQARYMEEEKGRAAAIAYLQGHRGPLVSSETSETGQLDPVNRAEAHSLINSPDEPYVQAKAMNVWWMLRDIVGETALTAALHNYNALDDTDPHYTQKLIEAQAHRDLAWFFDDWVYRDRGLPDFRIVSVYQRELANGGFMVTVMVENPGNAAAEVPVTVHMADGEKAQRLLVPAKAKTSVRILAPMLPQRVTVNDGSVPERETTNHVYKIEH